jgi:hypothetical protein
MGFGKWEQDLLAQYAWSVELKMESSDAWGREGKRGQTVIELYPENIGSTRRMWGMMR